MKIAWRLYRQLSQAFPHEFKLAYGTEMMQLGEDAMEKIAKRHGPAGLIPILADIAVRLPLEYLSEMGRDMRYAMRALIKSPGFAIVGIVSMGFGIGLTTNIYSAHWALLYRELPAAANASRLVAPEKPASYFYIERYREQKDLFAGVAAVQTGVQFNFGMPGQGNEKPERVFGQLVSPDYFSVLGVEAERGRVLSAELDKPGAAPAVVVSDAFWRNRLNASPFAVGQAIRLNGQTATIVGIAPRRFDGALSLYPSELFVPITVPPAMAPELADDVLHQRNAKEFQALMCLAPGVSIDAAEAALDGITRRLDKLDPMAPPQADKAKRVALLEAGTRTPIPRKLRPAVLGFYAALMAIVMAIACLNLATMLLARGANRRRELAIRLGVGASRFRLVRQMVSEGILLSLLGGAAGFALAFGLWVMYSHVRQPAGAPLSPDLALDWRAAVFTFALAVVCGIGFSVVPALQATRTDVAPALKEGSALELPGYRRFGMRNLAMAAQVAGSLMLLLVTGFLILGIMNGNSLETHFDQKTMAFLSIDPVRDGYSAQKAQAFFERLPGQLSSSGAVRGFAFSAQPPFFSSDDDDFLLTVDDPHATSPVERPLVKQTVGAGYFAALDEPTLAGREFEERDQRIDEDSREGVNGFRPAPLPVMLNEKGARALFADGHAIGKRLRDNQRSYEVVGVVPDAKDANGMTQSIAYLPLTRRDFARPPAGGIVLIVRSDTAADALSGARGVIASMDPNLTVFNVQTLGEYLELSRYAMRSALRTFGGIGLFGLVLTAIGLAGVTAYAVARRRREIGIRMALGARKGQVLLLVLREGVALVIVGSVVGFLGAVAVARLLSTLTSAFADAFKVGTDDPRLLIGAPVLLVALALLACYIPARRATMIEPLKALRQE
jgi:macrolide transport system ATP-binding/permease protein